MGVGVGLDVRLNQDWKRVVIRIGLRMNQDWMGMDLDRMKDISGLDRDVIGHGQDYESFGI